MPNLLVVIHTPVFGGPHNQVLRLTGPLGQRGWRTTVVLPDEVGGEPDRLAGAGAHVVQIPLHRLRANPDPRLQAAYIANLAPDIRRIRSIIRGEGVDVVQVCGLTHVQGAVAGHREGVGVTWQLLSTIAPWPLRAALMPIVARLSGSVMSAGRVTAIAHPGWRRIEDRLFPFYPPVDLGLFAPDPYCRAAARERLEVPPDAFLVGTVGNRNSQKGHDTLVRAFGDVRRRHPVVFLRILGNPTPTHARWYAARVEAEAARLGLLQDGTIGFAAPAMPVPDFLSALDVFVLASVTEGLPTALLEAMACGLPLVSTRVGGVTEVVVDGQDGLLVPPASPPEMAAALERLLGMAADDRAAVGDAARRKAHDLFGLETCADVHVRAFESAMARCGLPPVSG